MRQRLAGQFGLLGHSLPWAVPAAAAAVSALHGELIVGGDSNLFLWTGRTLLSSHWRDAFAASDVEVGPLQLLFHGSVGAALAAARWTRLRSLSRESFA